ncbi:hypothetical protein EHT25_22745 [Larkinella rosea]|uniref:DUF3592 domain-containing protein n=2 Tax=Larkinella rosea TaxID=2025312 RepID=A0A3P1BJ50_9BACT|nr:hypothetical protein EHT25_22745 [Larkinella rosea]
MDWPPSKALLVAFIPLAILLAAVPKMFTIYERKQIRKNSAITIGTVVRYEYVSTKYRQFYRACVQYSVDGKPFSGTSRLNRRLTKPQLNAVLNEKLPVIYEKGNPGNGVVLANEERFGNFGLMFPDSLRWTGQYFY